MYPQLKGFLAKVIRRWMANQVYYTLKSEASEEGKDKLRSVHDGVEACMRARINEQTEGRLKVKHNDLPGDPRRSLMWCTEMMEKKQKEMLTLKKERTGS